ncbi:Fpg/Nei family DNA glycosylase [Paenibacillus senegalensis]|uniref:Fpg/Nei family DNA glycosylase n=1 Tax=Paenibacillus senegalensis TaxID=1465766 RepID=UPI00028979DD|nr:DNA-formamidopyrimidine glycosylase family protein [Paenibacillus senegalensis]
MPELPEMETYRQLLTPRLVGQTIRAVRIHREKSVNLPAGQFAQGILGVRIAAIDRRAKYLLFRLETGQALLLHLMLGGLMFLGSEEDRPDRNTQVELDLSGGQTLYFIGLRLGYLHLLDERQYLAVLAKLGPEPLAPDFTLERFEQLLSGTRGTLKTTLVNQQKLSGIGNCYADEICFEAAILPTRPLASLSLQPAGDSGRLYSAMRAVLMEAIRQGGYMEQPLFAGDHLTGGYNDHCLVYDRGGEPCVRCGGAIIQAELSSRKVFYCAQCQH